MKKFEEELKNGPVMIDKDNVTGVPIYDEGTIISYFNDWVSPEDHQAEIEKIKSQLENQQPEIPEFVAAAIEAKNHIYGDFRRTANITHYSEDVRHWYYAKPYHAELFYRAILNGYTVAKEKRFYLKNKLTGLNLVEEKTFSLTGKHIGERFREFEMQYIPTDEQEARLYKNTFTQQEIDSMETGSYEQIEVGDD